MKNIDKIVHPKLMDIQTKAQTKFYKQKTKNQQNLIKTAVKITKLTICMKTLYT